MPKTAEPDTVAEDPSTRAAELQAELDQIRAGLDQDAVSLQIHADDPRSAFTVGGVTVTREPSAVPGHMVTPVTDAAAAAGVRLIYTEV